MGIYQNNQEWLSSDNENWVALYDFRWQRIGLKTDDSHCQKLHFCKGYVKSMQQIGTKTTVMVTRWQQQQLDKEQTLFDWSSSGNGYISE